MLKNPCLLFAAAAVCACGVVSCSDTPSSVAQKMVDMLKEVHDRETADAAAPRLMALKKKGIHIEENWESRSSEEKAADAAKFQKLEGELMAEVQRLAQAKCYGSQKLVDAFSMH